MEAVAAKTKTEPKGEVFGDAQTASLFSAGPCRLVGGTLSFVTWSHPFGHGLVPTIFWGRNAARGREALRLLLGLDPDGCMKRIRSRNRHPLLLKSRARSGKPTPEVRGPPVSRQPQPPGRSRFYRFDSVLLLKEGLLLFTGLQFAGASVVNGSENRHRTFAKK